MSDLHTVPPPLDGEVVMARREAGRSRDPELRASKCQGWYPGYGWWNTTTGTWSAVRPVFAMTVADAVTAMGMESILYVEMKQEAGKPRRRCIVSQYLPADVISLLKLSPTNATFRARVMACVGEMPPKELDTYDKIKDWVESTFPKGETIVVTKKEEEEPAIRVSYTAEETEVGRCKYRRTIITRGSMMVKKSEVVRHARSCTDIDEVMTEVRDGMENYAREQGATDYGAESTEDHDGEGQGMDVDYDYNALRRFVLAILREEIEQVNHEEWGIL